MFQFQENPGIVHKMYSEFKYLNEVKTDRRIRYGCKVNWTITFCYASNRVYAAAVFVRCEDKDIVFFTTSRR